MLADPDVYTPEQKRSRQDRGLSVAAVTCLSLGAWLALRLHDSRSKRRLA